MKDHLKTYHGLKQLISDKKKVIIPIAIITFLRCSLYFTALVLLRYTIDYYDNFSKQIPF